jgi:formylglycine-generating enzyme required for sulfatase activity
MDPPFRDLLGRIDRLSGQFEELREGIKKAVDVARVDPEMAVIRARKVLEYVVRDVFIRRLGEPPGTRPLENLIQRLVKDGHFPPKLEAYTETIRKLGNVGAHQFGEKVSVTDVFQSLTQLMVILEWYFEVDRPDSGVQLDLPQDLKPADPAKAQESVSPPASHAPVVPKGLRSFDAHDSDFFLQLLPGPRDKDGLPESIRFWKHRIECRDDPSFTVGVIYGPSGCGKSSLVKAGLLPRLARRVVSVYLEATPHDTEARILSGLRKKLPGLDTGLDLTQSITALRQGRGLSADQKVVLVIDQFEQWLHARRQERETELAAALRQYDGENVQCVVTVRDDFWVSLSRFMGDLRIEILQGQNAALVDLFDVIHARKVLIEFGRAFGRLPEGDGALSKDQETFVARAIGGLAQDDRIVPIRLALFADMIKSRPWIVATLDEVGGAQGFGVAFLEETFALAALRAHQKAGQAVLKALLPETGSNIKGNMRSHQELAQAAGYVNRQDDFDALLRVLDRDLRLITPTEGEGGETTAESAAPDERASAPSPQRGEGARRAGEGAALSVDSPLTTRSPQRGEVARKAGDEGVLESRLQADPGPAKAGTPTERSAGATPPSPQRGEGARRAGEGAMLAGDAPLRTPSPQRGEGARTPPPLMCPSDIFSPRGKGAGEGAMPAAASPLATDHSVPASDHSPLTTHHSPPATRHPAPSTRYYQLTHDYLVPSLRDWLTRKQRESRRGRAELRLVERAAFWNAKPEDRHLPSVWEWLSIRTLTNSTHWTGPQRKMMRQAARTHGWRSALTLSGMIAVAAAGVVVFNQVEERQEATRIEGLVGRLLSAEPSQVPDIVTQLDANPDVAGPLLARLISGKAETPDEKRAQLHARLAIVSRDPSQVESLVEELLAGKVTYVLPIRQLLGPARARLTERFRGLLRDDKADPEWRFRAALALADYVPASEAASWTDSEMRFVAGRLVSANAEYQPLLRAALRPINARLLGDLERLFADSQATESQQMGAANALADYAEKDVDRLTRLLPVATSEQFKVLYPSVAANCKPAAIEDLAQIAATPPPEALRSVERIAYGQRRAGAAVTLLRLGEREKVLPVLEVSDDPEALTQFIFRCRARGVGADALLDCLDQLKGGPANQYPRDARYALLLALGEFALAEVPESRRVALIKQLVDWYRHDTSSGVHGAAGWLLRQWGQTDLARQVDQIPVPYSPDREWFTLRITAKLTPPPEPRGVGRAEDASAKSVPEKRNVASRSKADAAAKSAASGEAAKPKPAAPSPTPAKTFCYTFVVFPAGESTIGSMNDEPERFKREYRHLVRLTRPFALLDREITFEELTAFRPLYADFMRLYEAKPEDAGSAAHWYDAVGFCRWLGQQMGLAENDQPYPDPARLDKERYPREPNPEANWAPRNWPLELGRPGFRLPTEAEWEVASRAGARTAYSYGGDESLLARFGWFVENSGKKVHPTRELRPVRRGLFDLHGNLWEWAHDQWAEYVTKASTDPLGPSVGSYRVSRGGCWVDIAGNCRSAGRNTFDPTRRHTNLGFRLALSPSRARPDAGAGK